MSDPKSPDITTTKEEERPPVSPDEVKESISEAEKAAEVVPASERSGKALAEEGTPEVKDSSSPASPGAKGSKEDKKKPRKRTTPKKDGPKKEPQQQEKGDEKEEEENAAEGSKVEGDVKNAAESPRVRKAPYTNPDRFKTGGQQKEKLSDEALVERMERIRLNNEKIKERRLTVVADEQAFKASQEVMRQKQVTERRIQDGINRSREQNAQRKMEKIQGREWDSEKNQRGGGPQSPAGRGRGRGGPPFTPTRTPMAKADSPGPANAKTPVRTPDASPTRTLSLTRDAPPHSTPTPALDGSDQAS